MESVQDYLKKYNQEHLLYFYNELDENEKEKLVCDIQKVDFELMSKLYSLTKKEIKSSELNISKLDNVYIKDKLNKDILSEWENVGTNVIKQNKFAVITMAGGQGTRLGHTGPKGTYFLDIFGKQKSIFELLIDKLKEAKEKYGITIQWYVMTSEENNDDTIQFFENNNYFKYGNENITFFTQGVLPMLDEYGKIILEDKHSIKFASDGNGGIFNSISKNVILDMKQKGIEYVYISGVDNILVNFVDEIFLGGMISGGFDVASKSVLKEMPEQKVGLFCKKDNKPFVIEYTEIQDNLLNLRKENGELYLCEANIVSSIYSFNLLERLCQAPLPYHVAKKKCNIINDNGEQIIPAEPNAYKFETFIFDSYSYIQDIFVLRVKTQDEFAPIKNKEGVDSPDTAVELYKNYLKNIK